MAKIGDVVMNLAVQRSLFTAGARVCVAISGGADSVALLLALIEANTAGARNKLPLGIGLSAVHVHHGLRGAEADADEAFVRELCARLEVPLTVERVDTAARLAAKPGEHAEGLEQAARALRYEVFWRMLGRDVPHSQISEARCAAPQVVDVIATAHTLDDQAETAMMKLLRGAWTEGLGGISPVVEAERGLGEASNKQFLRRSAALSAQDDPVQGGRIVRPMLRVRRSEVEAFLRERGQAWREDSGNTDLSLTRNRVRHVLMPLLRSFNPQADAMLANVAALAGEDEGFWQAEVARVLPQVLLPGTPVRGGGRAVGTAVGGAVCALELERLRVMPAALRSRVVRSAAQQLGVRLSFDETAKVLAAAGFGTHPGVAGGEAAKPGCKVELRAGLRAERSARELRLSRSAV